MRIITIGHSLPFDQVLLLLYSMGNVKDADCHCHTVIQGASEMGSQLSEKELQSALEFCGKCFNPTSPEHLAPASKEDLPKYMFDVTAPLMDPHAIESIISKTFKHTNPKSDQDYRGPEEDLKLALDQINGRRVVHREYAINNLEVEDVNGFVVKLQRGHLGLMRT